MYGPNDNFDLDKSHVLPALLRKMHLGKALENNDWEAIRKDLDILPIGRVNGSSSEKEILDVFSKYGLRIIRSEEEGTLSEVEVWGTGKPMREFLWSEDMADACIHLMENINFKDIVEKKQELSRNKNQIVNTHINIGTGKEIAIEELAKTIKKTIGFKGGLFFNSSKPDGAMRKLTDSSKLNALGWKYKIELDEGIQKMYSWYTRVVEV